MKTKNHMRIQNNYIKFTQSRGYPNKNEVEKIRLPYVRV